jgi:hypothetical protein
MLPRPTISHHTYLQLSDGKIRCRRTPEGGGKGVGNGAGIALGGCIGDGLCVGCAPCGTALYRTQRGVRCQGDSIKKNSEWCGCGAEAAAVLGSGLLQYCVQCCAT